MTTDAAARTAPDIELTAPNGEPVRLSALWSERPLVVAFFGDLANPFTGDNAAQLRDGHDAIEACGADLVAVAPATVEQCGIFQSRWLLPYPVLADPERAAGAAYGVSGIGSFVVDTAGALRFDRRTQNIADYPPTRALLEAVCEVTGAALPEPPAAPQILSEAAPASLLAGARPSAGYACAKCGYDRCERSDVSTAGGFLSRLFNLQHRKFQAVSCGACGYTELYRRSTGALGNVVDLLAN